MDSDCGSFECTDPAPGGWEGYYRINTKAYPNMAPSMCPDGLPPSPFFDTPSPGGCTACTCGAWGNAACAPPTLQCYTNANNCMGNQLIDLTGLTADGACFNVPNIPMNPARSCTLTALASVKDSGSCPPSGGALMFPEPWANQDDVCGQPIGGGSGCAGGQVCVPSGAGDYSGPVCIRKMGQHACPAGFPTKIEAATGENDDRACNACQCGVSGVTCTGGGYTVHDQDNCGGSNVAVNAMACVVVTNQLDGDTGAISGTTPAPANGTCAPSGGEASGSVMPQGVVTFCCK